MRLPGLLGMDNKRIYFGGLPKEKEKKKKAVHALDFQTKNKEPLSSREINSLIKSKENNIICRIVKIHMNSQGLTE